MHFNNNKEKDNIKAQYRNTRSKFYNKQASFDKDETKNQEGNHQQNTGGYWKAQGNEFYKVKNYTKAAQCYTKAIENNPGESQYYSNRSKCYQKLGNLIASLKDAEAACEINQNNIKAHYICGCILAQLGKTDDSKLSKAENRLKKALRLCTTLSAPEFSDEISIKIFRLRKLVWFKNLQRQLQSTQLQKQIIIKSYDKYGIARPQLDIVLKCLQARLDKLKQPRQIPDHLICKITLELMEDPVVSEAGFTYERKALEEHYKLKGPIEPINRKQCKGYIITNQALKITIEEFLNEHPWGFETHDKQDYRAFQMI